MRSLQHPIQRAAVASVATLIGFLSGCSAVGLGTGGSAVLVSAEQPTRLAPNLTTRVYRPIDDNTAEFYLTDLDPSTFDNPEALAAATGQLIHIHLFLQPKPGNTPIEPTACTATVRYFVLAQGRIGEYAGGGFLLPKDKPGEDRFRGKLSDATLRLTGATPGFEDRIGSGSFTMGLSTPRDDSTAAQLARTARRLALTVEPIE